MSRDREPVRLFVGNHPDTIAMMLPMLHLLNKHPGLVVVCWSVIGRLLYDHLTYTIHVPTKRYTGHATHRILLERLIASDHPQPIHPVNAITQTLIRGRDVFIAPAGAPPDRGRERTWHTGAARALQAALREGIAVETTGVHFHSTTLPPVEFTIPLDIPTILAMTPTELTGVLSQEYWQGVQGNREPRLREYLLRPLAIRL